MIHLHIEALSLSVVHFKTQNQILTNSVRKLLELTGNLNSKLPEADKEAEQVLQRFNFSQVMLNTFRYNQFALMNASLFYVLIITFLTILPLKYFGHRSF